LSYGLSSELRNFLRRTTSPDELQSVRQFGVDLGTVFVRDKNGYLYLCTKILGCIRDRQQSIEMGASGKSSRRSLHVAGWKRGAEWGLSEGRSRGSVQSPEYTSLSVLLSDQLMSQ
jgi:hypothetical protein